MRGKRISQILIILVMVIAVAGCKEKSSGFIEMTGGRMGTHITYQYDLFENKSIIEKITLKDALKCIDKTLTEDVYVYRYSNYRDGKYRFYGSQYADGVVVSDVTYHTEVSKKTGAEMVIDEECADLIVTGPIDTSNIISAEEAIEVVKTTASKHSKELCDYDNKGVYGRYLLCYDINNDRVVYEFEVNDYSRISIDANTADVVYEYYWDGCFYD